MTPSRAAQEEPTSPRTEAGRHEHIMWHRVLKDDCRDFLSGCSHAARIASVEREAAAATPLLDVERLARAMKPFTREVLFSGDTEGAKWRLETAAKFATEYDRLARLDEGSATRPLDAVHKLATVLHQRESAGQQRCGPNSRGCRMRHRMDATSILTGILDEGSATPEQKR